MPPLCGTLKSASHFYAGNPSLPAGEIWRYDMLDLAYLLLGLGIFALMLGYAAWAARA